jgi:uncharacterized protein (TIGR02117 family)
VTRLVLAVVAAILLSDCSAPNPPATAPRDATIYVVGRGWHTDIGLPVEEITAPLSALKAKLPGVRYLVIGFGDRTFLLSRAATPFSMLGALLPGRGALLVTALRATPQEAFGASDVVALRISRADLDHLQARLWREFELASSAMPIVLTDGPYAGSLFYAASAPYSGLYTCNTWTAEMMGAGGLPMPIGVLFAGQVMGMARWFASQPE